MRGNTKKDLQNFFTELNAYERKGIDIILNGDTASPMQVVQAHIMREDSSFMRDYVINDEGDIEELCFTGIDTAKWK